MPLFRCSPSCVCCPLEALKSSEHEAIGWLQQPSAAIRVRLVIVKPKLASAVYGISAVRHRFSCLLPLPSSEIWLASPSPHDHYGPVMQVCEGFSSIFAPITFPSTLK